MVNKKAKKTLQDYEELKKKESQNNYNARLKEEIKNLEEKKKQQPSGFKGTFIKFGINKSIYDKKAILKAEQRSVQATRLTDQYKKQIELEKAKGQLLDLRKKNQVSFDGLGGFNKESKQLRYEDLF
jgi:hypothetical protein